MTHATRIALGTAQFGMAYGVANRTGQVSPDEASRIVALARQCAVDTLDTAVAYGVSETILGKIGVADLRVVSKLPPLPLGCSDVRQWVFHEVQESLQRLNIGQLYGLLLHRPGQLLGSQHIELAAALCEIRDVGLATRIGVSIYDPQELEILRSAMPIELVQVPFNIVDRRLVSSGWLERLHNDGVEVHIRSVFLQGLLLMAQGERPAYFQRWQPLWQRWSSWLEAHHADALSACLGHVLSYPAIDRVVVGADSAAQFRQILNAAEQATMAPLPDELQSGDLELLNPSLWPSR